MLEDVRVLEISERPTMLAGQNFWPISAPTWSRSNHPKAPLAAGLSRS